MSVCHPCISSTKASPAAPGNTKAIQLGQEEFCEMTVLRLSEQPQPQPLLWLMRDTCAKSSMAEPATVGSCKMPLDCRGSEIDIRAKPKDSCPMHVDE